MSFWSACQVATFRFCSEFAKTVSFNDRNFRGVDMNLVMQKWNNN